MEFLNKADRNVPMSAFWRRQGSFVDPYLMPHVKMATVELANAWDVVERYRERNQRKYVHILAGDQPATCLNGRCQHADCKEYQATRESF